MRGIFFSVCLGIVIGCSQGIPDTQKITQVAPTITNNRQLVAAEKKVDHLIYIVKDLEQGILIPLVVNKRECGSTKNSTLVELTF